MKKELWEKTPTVPNFSAIHFLFPSHAILVIGPDIAHPGFTLIQHNFIAALVKVACGLIHIVPGPGTLDHLAVGEHIRLIVAVSSKEQIIVAVSHQAVTDFEHNIADSDLLVVHLVDLLAVILIAVVKTILRIILEPGPSVAVSAGIAVVAAGINLYRAGLIFILRAMAVIGKKECALKTGILFLGVTVTFHGLIIAINEHVSPEFLRISGSVKPVKRFV